MQIHPVLIFSAVQTNGKLSLSVILICRDDAASSLLLQIRCGDDPELWKQIYAKTQATKT